MYMFRLDRLSSILFCLQYFSCGLRSQEYVSSVYPHATICNYLEDLFMFYASKLLKAIKDNVSHIIEYI